MPLNKKKTDEKLCHIYYDIENDSASLSGNAKVLANAAGTSVSQTKNWLKSQPTYTLHRPARRHYPTRQYMVHAVDEVASQFGRHAKIGEIQSRISLHLDSHRSFITLWLGKTFED